MPEGFFELRSLEDADRIRAAALQAGSALVLGAGFIGLEMLENLVHLGLKVSLVEFQKQLLPALDAEMTAPLLEDLEKRGVELHLGTAVKEMLPGPRVRLDSGQELSADLVIVGLGVRPENQLAQKAGLALGVRGGIRVNAQMQTSHPDVYAVGDAVETFHVVSGAPVQIPLAGPANRQGRLAADAMCQKAVSYRGSQGTAIVGVFDLTAATTGLTEKQLKANAQDYRCIYLHPNHHAGYYPGAEGMSIKLLFEPTFGKILGAQAVGGAGVDKRIDLFALAIQAGLTVFDLEQAELCYAPPYGSAKDPVNMAAFIAANSLRGEHPICHQVRPEHLVIDVRTPAEFTRGHVSGALNLPLDELRSRLAEIPPERPLLVYCQVGLRGYLATRILMQKGYAVENFSGGYLTYSARQKVGL